MQDSNRAFRLFVGMQEAEDVRRTGINNRVQVNLPDAFQSADVKRVLIKKFART